MVNKKAAKKRAFVFTGDPINGQDPDKLRFFGVLFTLNGRKVSVSDEIAEQICNNSHFTEK